ncbi:two-component sensor histidine kinase [Azospirillum agricola]|uniref:sensor histidine kinase n=1 Tax=Azospirillum agricola TaxID=1720247 RepID=UPI001AE348FF|nr:sensor histidine kinase [Azospirillum agricola]MBP2233319.1 two-component sensor histidine kinase [Azospirillum agricola]
MDVATVLGARLASILAVRRNIACGLLSVVVPPLVAMALVAIGLIAWNFSHQRRFAEAEMVRTARALSVALDRQLLITTSALESLAVALTEDDDLERAYHMAQDVKAKHPYWSHVTLRTASGDVLFTTSAPLGTAVRGTSAVDGLVKDVADTGRPRISDLLYGPIAQAPVAAVLVPVPRRDAAARVLVAVVTATKWQEMLWEEGIAEGWVAGIIDRTGIVVARTRGAERFVGKPAPGWVLDALGKAPSGWAEGPALEGEPLSLAFSRSALSGWTVAFAAPASLFEQPLRRSLWLAAAVSGTAMMAALAFVLAYARRLSRSMAGLVRTVDAMRQPGAALPPAPAASAELALVYESMRDANLHLLRAEQERTTAMRELQHRVKNDLQAIMGLISMERFKTGCAGSCGILDELEGRIETLRLVHSRLYEARQVGTVELGGYLRELCANVVALYGRSHPGGITLTAQVDNIHVSHDVAVPLGLIVNEFVTNSAKHAFPQRPGRITLDLAVTEAGQVRLRLADDGVGLAVERARSSGLQLIEMLAQQIGAEPEWAAGVGTSLQLSFQVEAMAEAA